MRDQLTLSLPLTQTKHHGYIKYRTKCSHQLLLVAGIIHIKQNMDIGYGHYPQSYGPISHNLLTNIFQSNESHFYSNWL